MDNLFSAASSDVAALSQARSLCAEYEAQIACVQQDVEEAALAQVEAMRAAHHRLVDLKTCATQGKDVVDKELLICDGCLGGVHDVIASLSDRLNDLKAEAAVQEYVKRLWQCLHSTDTVRANLASLASVGVLSDLKGCASTVGELFEVLRLLAALPPGYGYQAVFDRCRSLISVAQPLLEAGFQDAVKACGWPKPEALVLPASAAGTMFAMLVALQGLWEAVLGAASLPWVARSLCASVEARFRFHFCGRQASNRPDKPEWMFVHALGVLRASVPFLNSLVACASATTTVAGFDSVSGITWRSLYHAFIGSFVQTVSGRVLQLAELFVNTWSNRAEAKAYFVHLIDEVVSFEKQLREEFGFSADVYTYCRSCLYAVENSPVLLECWVKWDREVCEMRLRAELESTSAWKSKFDELRQLLPYHPSSGLSTHSDSSSHQPSNSADVLAALIDAVIDRCRALTLVRSRTRLVQEVLGKCVNVYLRTLQDCLSVQNLELDVTSPDWQQFLSMINSALFVRGKLLDVQCDGVLAEVLTELRQEAGVVAPLPQVEQLGRAARIRVVDVVSSAGEKVKQTLTASHVLRGFDMFGIGVVARTLLSAGGAGSDTVVTPSLADAADSTPHGLLHDTGTVPGTGAGAGIGTSTGNDFAPAGSFAPASPSTVFDTLVEGEAVLQMTLFLPSLCICCPCFSACVV